MTPFKKAQGYKEVFRIKGECIGCRAVTTLTLFNTAIGGGIFCSGCNNYVKWRDRT